MHEGVRGERIRAGRGTIAEIPVEVHRCRGVARAGDGGKCHGPACRSVGYRMGAEAQ